MPSDGTQRLFEEPFLLIKEPFLPTEGESAEVADPKRAITGANLAEQEDFNLGAKALPGSAGLNKKKLRTGMGAEG